MLPALVRQFNEFAVDRMFYALNSAESVRCGPRQFPTLHGVLREACAVLDVAEPELYLSYNPRYNAYAAGEKRTFIVLHSSLVDHFTDEELLFVVGHELGHVKCGHVLYQMLGQLLALLLTGVGDVTLGIGRVAMLGLLSAFYEWMRQAEFSADRAGLLACQDPGSALSATMKLGCGNSRLGHEMNVDAFLEQARDYSEYEGLDGAAKLLLFFLYTWRLDHPQVVYRAKGLDEWVRSGAYEKIVAGFYARTDGSEVLEDEEPI
jgi:Zn-dependent protease with chaperone function